MKVNSTQITTLLDTDILIFRNGDNQYEMTVKDYAAALPTVEQVKPIFVQLAADVKVNGKGSVEEALKSPTLLFTSPPVPRDGNYIVSFNSVLGPQCGDGGRQFIKFVISRKDATTKSLPYGVNVCEVDYSGSTGIINPQIPSSITTTLQLSAGDTVGVEWYNPGPAQANPAYPNTPTSGTSYVANGPLAGTPNKTDPLKAQSKTNMFLVYLG